MLKVFIGVPLLAAVVRIVAAAADGGSADSWLQVAQWGPAGVVLVLLGTGQLRFNREVQTERERTQEALVRADKAESWKDDQIKYNQEKVIPLMADTTRTLVDVGRALQITPSSSEPAISAKVENAMSEIRNLLKSVVENNQ